MFSDTTLYFVLSGVAMVFGTLWTATNFYNYYPVVQSKVNSLVAGTSDSPFIQRTAGDLDEQPTIDVFIPAYHEEDVIHQSITSIRETAYPNEKLGLHVLIEPDDDKMQYTVEKLQEQFSFNVITVPEKYPGTPNKPRALNYAFEVTDGELVGIIDAENIVDDQMFATVAGAFSDPDLDYVQGMVDMVNEDDGWLNLLFRAEYGYWYRLIVPAFQRLGFPIPLSGTACFFRRQSLKQISKRRYDRTDGYWGEYGKRYFSENGLAGYIPWDPRNVTEDFELGLLLWAENYDFGLLDIVTYEESPRTFSNWLEQRTRWQKGKLYTFIEFLRRPVDSKDKMSHLLWQSFLPHLGPLNVAAIVLLVAIGLIFGYVPQLVVVISVLLLSMVFFLVSSLAYFHGYWRASTKSAGSRLGRGIIVVLTIPFYWVLQWFADLKAFRKIVTGDLSWERTIHRDYARLDEIQALDSTQSSDVRGLLRDYLTKEPWLYPILGLAILVRIPDITRSLWLDEIYSVVVRPSMGTFGMLVADELHPPLYYVLLKAWMTVFGNSPVASRSFSVFIGLLIVPSSYLFARELYDRKTGLLTALFTSLSVLMVQFSQTARMYILLVLFAVLSLYFYLRVLKTDSMEVKFGYGLCTTLMLLTHLYGWFVILAQLLHIGVIYIDKRRFTAAKRWAQYQIPVYFVMLPWMGFIFVSNYFFSSNQTIGWLVEPNIRLVSDIFLSYSGVPRNYPKIAVTEVTQLTGFIMLGIFILLSVYLVFESLVRDESYEDTVLLGSILVTSVGVPLLFSLLVFPIVEIRHAIIGFVPFSMILARGIVRIDQRTLRVVLVAVIVVLSGVHLVTFYQTPPGEDWEGLGEDLNEKDISSDLLVFIPDYTTESATYYMDEESKQEADIFRFDGNERELQQQLETSEYQRVWVVRRGTSNISRVSEIAEGENFDRASTQSYGQAGVPVELIGFQYKNSTDQITGNSTSSFVIRGSKDRPQREGEK